jgi:hypothetical protein
MSLQSFTDNAYVQGTVTIEILLLGVFAHIERAFETET